MKKLLLTLGTTAVIATPLVTVIACGQSSTPVLKSFEPSFNENAKELTVARTTYVNKSDFESTITEASIKSFLNDLHIVWSNNVYDTSEKIKLTKDGEETKNETITISDITFDPGTTSTNVNPTTLAEVKALSWQAANNAYINGKLMNLTANENMTWQLFSKAKTTVVDDTAIRTALIAETFESTKTREQLEAVASETAISAEEANTKFGINSTEFAKITTALGSDWEFVNLGYNTSQSKLKLVYRHKEEQSNKEVELTTNLTTLDDSSIRTALDALNITSTKNVRDLKVAAGTPATSETDANTMFGIVKAEFDSIITALGGISSDWKFVNIDFNVQISKFKLTYKHLLEQNNRDIYLTSNFIKEDDSAIIIELNKLNITSTKTLAELTNAAGTPATSETDANTKFGIVKAQFDPIINILKGGWEFVNIDFNTTSLKFKLTYSFAQEFNNREIDLTTNFITEDDSEIIIELNKLNITSNKTFNQLAGAAGNPATSEEDANTRFGIVKAQFDSIITALGGISSDWKFVNIDFNTISSKFKLTYKNSSASNNKEINLTTTVKSVDETEIINDFNKLNIISTKTLTELIENGSSANNATDAETRLGIVKAKFDSILAILGGPTSDWKFLTIDYNITQLNFAVTYFHSLNPFDTKTIFITAATQDQELIRSELSKLTIISTKTLKQLEVVASASATTEEEANTNFGVNSIEFQKIKNVIGDTDWIFHNLTYSLNENKFIVRYKHPQLIDGASFLQIFYLNTEVKDS